jgi:cytochrome P450
MEYLQACMKEAIRIHQAVGQLLERIIPEGGAQFGDFWLPGGTIVGINPWVVGRERAVYGDDVDEFRPERWLGTDREAAKAMQRNFLAVRFEIYISTSFWANRCSISLDQEGDHV